MKDPLELTPDEEILSQVLQTGSIDFDPGEQFDSLVLREVKLDWHARTLKFWAPAIVSAIVAGLAVLSAIEVVCIAPSRKQADLHGKEARLERRQTPVIPDLKDATANTIVK